MTVAEANKDFMGVTERLCLSPLQPVICASLLSGLGWLLQRGSPVAPETPAGTIRLSHSTQLINLLFYF